MDASNNGFLLNLVEKYRALQEKQYEADEAAGAADRLLGALRSQSSELMKEIRKTTGKSSVNVRIGKVLYEIRPEGNTEGLYVYITETPIDIEE